jgi:hypothetical protein
MAALKEGRRVTIQRLHYFDFASGVVQCWEGMGDFISKDDRTWTGAGPVVKVEGGGYGSGLSAGNLKIGVEIGKDDISDRVMNAAINSKQEIYGRRYFSAFQFFGDDLQPLDLYRPYYIGVMDRIIYRATATSRELSLNIEGPFVRKKTPRLMYFTDRDQRRRKADDGFLQFTSTLASKAVVWPKY